MSTRWFGAVLLLFSARAATAQEPPTVVDAQTAFQEADLDEARSMFEALADGEADGAVLAEAYRYLAAIALLYGEEPTALRYARWAVAVQDDVLPPPGAPSGLGARLDAFRARLTTLSIAVARDGAQRTVTATLRSGAPEVFGRVRLRCGDHASDGGGAAQVQYEATAEEVTCVAEAFSRRHVRLREVEVSIAGWVAPELVLAPEPPVAPPPTPRRRRRILGIVLGAVVVGAALGLGVGLRPGRTNEFVGPVLE